MSAFDASEATMQNKSASVDSPEAKLCLPFSRCLAGQAVGPHPMCLARAAGVGFARRESRSARLCEIWPGSVSGLLAPLALPAGRC